MPSFLKDGGENYNKMRRIHPRDAISKLDYYLPTTPINSYSLSSSSLSARTSDGIKSSSSSAGSVNSSKLAYSAKINRQPQKHDESFVRKRRRPVSPTSNHKSVSGSSGALGSPFQTSGYSDGTLIAEQTISEKFQPPSGIIGLQDRNCYILDGQQHRNNAFSGRKKSRIVSSSGQILEELVRLRSGKPRSGGAAAIVQFLSQHPHSPNQGTRLNRRNIKRRNRRALGADGDIQLGDDYALSELFSQSEIPGFREIFASDSYLRKFCWIAAFLFMTVLSLNDMTELITEYFEYPVTVDVRLKDSARLPFPAVTVCNLNVVRYSGLCSPSSSRFDLANQIPSELRDKLCGLQVDKKNNHNSTGNGADSDLADINNIGITTTTTTTTTSTTTTTTTTTTTSRPDDLEITATQPTSSSEGPSNQTSNPNDGGGEDDLVEGRPPPDGVSSGGASTAKSTTRRTSQHPMGDGVLDLGSSDAFSRSGRKRVGAAGHRISRSIKLSDLQQDENQHQPRPFASSKSRVRVWSAQSQQDQAIKVNVMRTNQAAGANRVGGPSGVLLQPSQHGTGRPGGANGPSSVLHQNPLLPGGGFVSTQAPSSAASATTSQSAAGSGHQVGQGQGNVINNSPTALPEDFELTERQERELQENLTNWLAVMYNRDPQLTRSLGHQFDDMILRCTMKSINCTHQRSFENSFTPTEGNCFTYRSKIRRRLPVSQASSLAASQGLTGSSSRASTSSSSFEEANLAGTNHGLELVLNLEKNEYISGSSQVGALVMIHHPSDLGYAASEATFVPPEYTTYIGLKMVNLTRLPAPYPEYCVDSWPSKFADTLTRNSTYSQQACLKICLQKTIQSHCQCQSAFLPIVELESNQFHSSTGAINSTSNEQPTQTQRIIICDTRKLNTRQCVRNVMFRAADRVHNCDCPPKCQVVRYDKTISMAKWPTKEDKVSFDRGKMDVNFQNLAKVIVYFQTMTCDEITQQAVFNAAKLFSALGGIMGMYVGFSFLSVFEIFEVMSRKMWHHLMVRLSRASTRFAGGRFRA